MLDVITDWAKNICLALILISILEMLLPNNKTKKYVKMVMGIYLLFNIISPIISNQETFSLSNFDINDYTNNVEMQTSSETVNQSSMDKRIQEIYLEELEKDITNKLENKGYKVNKCAVKGSFENNEENGISEIYLEIEQGNTENNSTNNEISENTSINQTLEDVMVKEIQKIKEIDIGKSQNDNEEETNLNNTDIQKIKEFLIEEYGVSEKCLKIN